MSIDLTGIDLTGIATSAGAAASSGEAVRPSIADLRLAYRWAQERTGVRDVLTEARVVTVLSARGGAGSSTLALALAEAIATTGPARLLDVADPVRSGLVCATTTEMGPDGNGWLLGMRGPLAIDRRDPARRADSIPTVLPAPRRPDPGQVVVVDQGTQHLGRWEAAARHGGHLVVVAAASTPALRTAALLLGSHRDPVLVVVGARRLARRLLRSGPPALAALHAQDRVVVTPFADQHLAVDGITARPLGRSLAAAGAELMVAMGLATAPLPDLRTDLRTDLTEDAVPTDSTYLTDLTDLTDHGADQSATDDPGAS